MKPIYLIRAGLILCVSMLPHLLLWGQCPGTATTATIKWDNRNYLVTTGNYASGIAGSGTGVTTAMSQSQNFTLGTNRLNIATTITTLGQNTTIQSGAQVNSYGSGAAVEYNGNGTITLTLDTVAANFQFSLYAIDKSQIAVVTAKDAAGNALNVAMSTPATGTIVISGNGTTAAQATALPTTVAFTSNTSTVNVMINGFAPAGTNGVKTVTITISGTAGTFWLSDIAACVYRSFTNNYYTVAKPYTGQPAYFLNTSNAPTISMTDPATGNCRYISKDNVSGNKWLNSFGYDPYDHWLFYFRDGMNSTANRALKKYDFNTLSGLNATMSSGTSSTLIADITLSPFYIPVFDIAVESGAASFYDGSLYVGIEGTNSSKNSGRYSMIWRIDFDASGNPTHAAQAFAVLSDNGTNKLLHDWGDFSCSNGIIYDFNSASPGSYIHYDLQTGMVLNTFAPLGPIPGESGTIWNENVYWIGSLVDSVALYNKNGSIATEYHLAGKASIDWTPTASGDGSDAFKPPLDYGDAPSSYDPSGFDPACHDYDSTLKLGSYWNCEFAKKTSSDASGDGATDDGISITPIFTNAQNTYNVWVNVYNHSGAAATLIGWIDFNNDGIFQTSEGSTPITVNSATGLQMEYLTWSGAPTISGAVTSVFMRIRVTSAGNGMTTGSPLGYFSNGEVEDYSVPVSAVLATKLVSFDGALVGNGHDVRLSWQMANEMNMQSYTVERSTDGQTFGSLRMVTPRNLADNTQSYTADDQDPLTGNSYYRLKLTDYTGSDTYSQIVRITLNNAAFNFSATPNPFKTAMDVNISLARTGTVVLRLIDANGTTVFTQSVKTTQGSNLVHLDRLPDLPQGLYILEAVGASGTARRKVVKE